MKILVKLLKFKQGEQWQLRRPTKQPPYDHIPQEQVDFLSLQIVVVVEQLFYDTTTNKECFVEIADKAKHICKAALYGMKKQHLLKPSEKSAFR